MPNCIGWTLQYPFGSESDGNLLRTHFEALKADPRIEHVHLSLEAENPSIRTMRVTFREGYDQPANPDYRFLNRRFPVRPSMGLAPLHGLSVIHHDARVTSDVYDPPYASISLQQHPEAKRLPPWVLQGQWARDQETGKCFCISGITAASQTLFILGVPIEREGDPLYLDLNTFLRRFTSAEIPRAARLTAWEVILRDIDEKD
jgi:hypothetical protein